MINRSKIDDWIRQVEATPIVAPLLIRQIMDRLIELDQANESLRAENLELSSGNRVKELEKKISELEFQVDLLKRQLSGHTSEIREIAISLLVFNDRGQVVRLALNQETFSGSQPFATVSGIPHIQSRNFYMTTVFEFDQLLLVTSSGRTMTVPAEMIPAAVNNQPDWSASYQVDLHTQEELIWILPITRLHNFNHCIQVSRFGYGRKIDVQFFKTFIANHNLGKGTKFNFDRTLNLILSNDDQTLVLASKAGNLISLETASLPISLTEIIKFKVGDYAVSAGLVANDQVLVGVTHTGFAFLQSLEGVKAGKSFKHKLAPGAGDGEGSLVGAIALFPKDWVVLYREDGTLTSVRASAISSKGSLLDEHNASSILAIAVYSPSQAETKES
jgi:DNA gyrase/topoisomerase IV subunit A